MNSLGLTMYSLLPTGFPLRSETVAVTRIGFVSNGIKVHSRPPDLKAILAGFKPVVGVIDHSTEPFVGISELLTAKITCSPT